MDGVTGGWEREGGYFVDDKIRSLCCETSFNVLGVAHDRRRLVRLAPE